jgi:hypothetical protein
VLARLLRRRGIGGAAGKQDCKRGGQEHSAHLSLAPYRLPQIIGRGRESPKSQFVYRDVPSQGVEGAISKAHCASPSATLLADVALRSTYGARLNRAERSLAAEGIFDSDLAGPLSFST